MLRPCCLQSLCGEGGGIDIGRRDGSGILEGRVGGGREAVCIESIAAEGEVDDSDPTGAVEVEVVGADGVFFLGVLTLC